MSHIAEQTQNLKSKIAERCGNFIDGQWRVPLRGRYFTNHGPINGARFVEFAESTPDDVELALDAAHAAQETWAWNWAANRQTFSCST